MKNSFGDNESPKMIKKPVKSRTRDYRKANICLDEDALRSPDSEEFARCD